MAQPSTPRPDRRTLLRAAVLTAGAVGALPAFAQSGQSPSPERAPDRPRASRLGAARGQLFWTVETAYGQVQGIANGGIKQFKGIPYGADTGGRNRYMPPRKPSPWTGVRDCIGFGPISPQAPMDLTYDYAMTVFWDRLVGEGRLGEDCLNLNVWTPGVNDGRRRAVMVSFHGGGWSSGSANGVMYDGAQLARFGDVVVVTVNHRLAAFGYAQLADLGAPPEFADSGLCGVMDMVASLEWIRDNIERFGGDPNRVMIFGQSGGGSKVSTLMATPAAKGLFHRAAIQSGSTISHMDRAEATMEAEKLLRALGIPRGRVADIQKVTWQRLLEAQVQSKGNFRPSVDGRTLPHQPFAPTAPIESADVPVIISTTLHDHATRYDNFDLDEQGLLAIFSSAWGERAPQILAAYRKESPRESPFRIQAKAFTDATRGTSMLQAARKAALGRAPVYMYVWDWVSPMYDGRYGAVHCHDVDAGFHQYRSPITGSGTAEGRLMCDRMAGAYVAFAKTGDPNNPSIPAWPPYDPARRATMVFDARMRVVDDYRGAFVRLINPPKASG